MNIFSNVGVTEIIIILLLALLVVGPERLPEVGRKLGKALRDVRRVYENLSRDLGPELQSIQQPIQELRESVDSIRSIPASMVQSVVKAADMEDAVGELRDAKGSVAQAGKVLSDAGRAVTNPVGAALGAARSALQPSGHPPAAQAGTAAGEAPAKEAPAEGMLPAQHVSADRPAAEDEEAPHE